MFLEGLGFFYLLESLLQFYKPEIKMSHNSNFYFSHVFSLLHNSLKCKMAGAKNKYYATKYIEIVSYKENLSCTCGNDLAGFSFIFNRNF